MSQFIRTNVYRQPPGEVFAFFRRPASRLQLAPPELRLQLVSGPEQVELGSRITLRGRRAGVTQHLVSEVTTFVLNQLLVEEQRRGPFRQWVHTYRFEPTAAGGTQLTEQIDYEPPGGMLGLLLTAAVIEREVTALFDHRLQNWPELPATEEGIRTAADS